MATLPQPRLMTVEESRSLRDLQEEFVFELHHGELVKMTRPKHKHNKMQKRLVHLLEPLIAEGYLWAEVPYRALPEYELRVADVAYLSEARSRAAEETDDVFGAPDLVIEVLSPSNTALEIFEKEQLCLRNGCKEFWTVNLKRKEIRVTTEAGVVKTYGENDEVPLAAFGGTVLKVAEVFAE